MPESAKNIAFGRLFYLTSSIIGYIILIATKLVAIRERKNETIFKNALWVNGLPRISR